MRILEAKTASKWPQRLDLTSDLKYVSQMLPLFWLFDTSTRPDGFALGKNLNGFGVFSTRQRSFTFENGSKRGKEREREREREREAHALGIPVKNEREI